ncbi:MAG: cupin domain-containing protein [Prevotellaceae bacterium]|jgi:uncharacterized cupin superfamily protein|nr:cupin domain-containing protein [Prevotellaceae bacterium]
MATILKSNQREFKEEAFKEEKNKVDPFRLFTDISRERKGVNPKQLNFDLRQLNPSQYAFTYHFHRHAEELFLMLSGSATLRTPAGLETVSAGDLIFFEMGETGAHQLYNHTSEPCTYLDVRAFIGFDVCEYPDSGKINILPTDEIFRKDAQVSYFDREENVRDKWKEAGAKI